MIEVVVRELWNETADVAVLVLEALPMETLPGFEAGAHIDLKLRNGVMRQYSLSNRPCATPDHYRIAVKRERQSRGGSAYIHDRIEQGDRIAIDGPRNAFRLSPDAAHHVLCGAGIGITPILSMAHHLAWCGDSFSLYVFATSETDLAFAAELSTFTAEGEVAFHLGLSPQEVAETLGIALSLQPQGAHLYTCGPVPFMDAVREASANWSEGSFHQEYFSGRPVEPDDADRPFEVTLQQSGKTYVVPVGRSILDVLTEAGICVPNSCQQGTCGSCLTAVLEGIPDHRDSYLSDRERSANDCMLLCVSRCKGSQLILGL